MVRSGQVGAPELIGRDRELRLIVDTVDRVARGSGTALLISGDAGLGKTSLARQALEKARALGFETLVGRCHPLDQGLAYAPVIEAFGRFLRACDQSRQERLIRHLPALGRLFEGLDLPVPDPLGDAALEKTRLFEAVLRLVGRLASERPVALLFDDLHWADPASLELLTYISRELIGLPALFIGTYRREEMDPAPRRFRLLLESLRREVEAREIALEAMARDEVEGVLARLLKGTPSPEAMDLIARRSGGVPLFVEAFARWLIDNGGLIESRGRWMLIPDAEADLPPVVRDTIVSRLERLHPPQRQLLDTVAVGGEGVPRALVGAVLEERVDLSAEVAGLVQSGLLIEEVAATDAIFRFSHTLVHEVAYESIPTDRRRELHVRFARALGASGDVVGQAAHYLAAGPAVEPAEVVEALLDAGRRALARYAAEEALRFLQAALQAAGTARPDLVGEILVQLGEAWLRSGKAVEAIGVWRSALEGERALMDPLRRARLHCLVATAESGRGDFAAAEHDVQAGLAILEDFPPRDEVLDLLWVRAINCARQLDPVGELDAVRQVQQVAAQVATLRARCLAVATRILASIEGNDYGAASTDAADLRPLVADLEDPELLRRGRDLDSLVAAAMGDLHALRLATQRSLLLAREMGVPGWHYRVHLYAFVEALYSGDWDRAWEVIREAESIAQRQDNPWTAAIVPLIAGILAAYQAEFDSAADRLATAQSLIENGSIPDVHGGVMLNIVAATVAVERGEVTSALELIERNQDRFGQGLLPPWGLVVLAEARIGTRRVAAAREVIARLAGMGPEGTYPTAMAGRLEGLAHLAEGDRTEAMGRLHYARRAFDKLGMPFEVTRATIEVAEASPEPPNSLVADLTTAYRTAVRLGATRYGARAGRLLRATGAPLPPSEPSLSGELTPRQLEIAERVAKGMSNAEIAETLYISVRTVTSHLDHIYTRLGIGSRAALAAYVTDRRHRAYT
jgi:DNA-binding CsgD family transcriptional regulator/tetratricopeptide (TPR) repeat protein